MREFLREPEAVFWVFIFPVLLAFALGVAFRNRPPDQTAVAVDNRMPQAAQVMEVLSRSPDVKAVLLPPEAAAQELRTGKADLEIGGAAPEEKAAASDGNALPAFSFRFDPTRPQSRAARLLVEDVLQRGWGRTDVVRVREEYISESGARYIDFLIPGLIGLNLMGSGMWGVGFNIVQARTRKLLKLFTATPMQRSHFLLSFMLSRLVFLVLEVVALIGFGWVIFGVKVHGSIASLSLVTIIGAMTFAGLGLLTASRSRSVEAVSGWMNFVMLPMWLLSGSFFSYSRFPEFTYPFIRALPLTALNDALRAIMNDGTSIFVIWPAILVLAAWGILSFVVALKIFRWQ
jgi:ABC-type multidrug transport system permease subunit